VDGVIDTATHPTGVIGDHVTLNPVETIDQYGMTVVRAQYDGDYPKDNLPDPLIMSNYLVVRDQRIVTLFVIRNTPVQY
jgi:hypothetical protein